jgi:hypothetical protein
MIVRFDNKAIKEQRQAHNTGVEGDPETLKGTMSEADAIVSSVKKLQEEGHVPEPTPNAADEREAKANEPTGDEGQGVQEVGPELKPEGLQEVKKKKEENLRKAVDS